MEAVLAVDVGTSNMRGILYDLDGNMIFKTSVGSIPIYESDCCVKQKAEVYLDHLTEVVRTCAKAAAKRGIPVIGITTTALRSCVLAVDREGEPLSEIVMWQDKRAAGVCEELKDCERQVYEHTGVRLYPVFSGVKAAWMKRQMPDIYKKAALIATVADYLHYKMTGVWASDYTYGSRTGLMNIRDLEWDDQMLRLFGLDREKLCPLIPQGSVLGRLTPAFAAACGLAEGTPVVTAGGDQQCGALGAGVMESGSVQATTGTGAYLIACSGEPVLDPDMRFLCNVSAVQGQYIVEASMLSSAILYEWFFREFYDEKEEGIQKVNREAWQSPVGSKGIIVLPYFQGRGSPDWNSRATGSFLNVTLQNTRGDFARALLEGIALETAENLSVIEEYTGPASKVCLSGGLTKSELFNQIQADACGRTLLLGQDPEATAKGAFLSAAMAFGIVKGPKEAEKLLAAGKDSYSPVRENTQIYREMIQKRKRLYRALEDA